MRILVLHCSLSDNSRSSAAAAQLVAAISRKGGLGVTVSVADLMETIVKTRAAPCEEALPESLRDLSDYSAVAIFTPVYHNSVSGLAKLVIDYIGDQLQGKAVGIVTAGGSARSTLAAASLATPLSQGCGAIVLPEHVHIDPEVGEAEVVARLDHFLDGLIRLSASLTRLALDGADVSARLPTASGNFTITCFAGSANGREHVALWKRSGQRFENPVVRIHSECLTGDLFGSRRCDCGEQLDRSLKLIGSSDEGAILYLRQEGRGIGLPAKLAAYNLQDSGFDTIEANEQLGFPADMRSFDDAVHILKELGIERLQLITNNPDKIEAIKACGIEITNIISTSPVVQDENRAYILTKKNKMGHTLPSVISL